MLQRTIIDNPIQFDNSFASLGIIKMDTLILYMKNKQLALVNFHKCLFNKVCMLACIKY